MKNIFIMLLCAVTMSLGACRKTPPAQPCGCNSGPGGNNGNNGNGQNNYLPPLGQGVMYAEVKNDPNSQFNIDMNCDGVISGQELATGGFYDISVTDGQGNWYTMYGRLNILNDINGNLDFPPMANPDPASYKPVLKVTVAQTDLGQCGSFWEVKSVQWFGFYPIGMGKSAHTTGLNYQSNILHK